MNLTKRLIVSNAVAVIIPLVITAIVALAYIFIFGQLFNSQLSFKNFQSLSEIRFELIGNKDSILNQNPEVIKELNFQQHLQNQLSLINGELIILKDDQILFSSRNFSKIDVAKCIEAGKKTTGKQFLTFGNLSYSVQLIDVSLNDGSFGNVILLAPYERSEENLAGFLMLLCITFLLSFLLTTIFISLQFSRTIVTPLNNLQKAATEITNGNLSFQIAEEGDCEIQELCRDLELMRIKLKESINKQLKYEDNRKMLVSSISHDLKTPVTTIKGYVEGILDGIASTPDKTEKYLKTIYLKAQQVDRMIDDLLFYAKLDLNQIPFNFVKADLANYLIDCIAEIEPELENYHVKITIENRLLQHRFVNLDRERMRRVLINILDNSRKYMDKELGEIKILLRETNASLIIEIRDNGSGISEIDLPHIFDRFYRSDLSRSDIKGSGLGLAIAKQIIEGHFGRIWAVSHGSEGTSVMISLSKS